MISKSSFQPKLFYDLSQCLGHLSQVLVMPVFHASSQSPPRVPLSRPLMLCSQRSRSGSQDHSHPQCSRAVFAQMWKTKGRSSSFPYTDKEHVPLEDMDTRSKSLKAEMKRAQTHS